MPKRNFFQFHISHCRHAIASLHSSCRLVNELFLSKYGQQACETIKVEVGDNWRGYVWPLDPAAASAAASAGTQDSGTGGGARQPGGGVSINITGNNHDVSGGNIVYGNMSIN